MKILVNISDMGIVGSGTLGDNKDDICEVFGVATMALTMFPPTTLTAFLLMSGVYAAFCLPD